MVDEEVERFANALRAILEEQSISVAEVERRLGWGKGTFTKRLRGTRELKLRQLLSILAAINVDPLYYFLRVFGVKDADGTVARTIRNLDHAPGTHRPLTLPQTVDEAELRRLIQEAVEQAIGPKR